MSFEGPLGYNYLSADAETERILWVDVGWGESTVYKTSTGSDAAQIAITEAFVTAMASWFSLVLMTGLVSQFLRVSAVDMANKRRRLISDQRGRAIRFTFMDTSNASRPVRWAFRERDILLLDRIHATWTTRRWWQNVEERTTLLTAHHADVAADIRRVADKRLAWLVIGLAAITSMTAVRDFTATYNEKHWGTFGIMSAVLFLVVVLGVTLLRERSEELDE